jgi:hypothetical protein
MRRSRRLGSPRRAALAAVGVVAAIALSGCLPVVAPPPPGVYGGLGFDTCAAPPISYMSAWLASPYRSIGVYIGGANAACVNLSASWVGTVANEGWRLAPLYVGLQDPCAYQGGLGTIDPNQPVQQGVASANDAVQKASADGLGPGTPIYFDMEAYNNSDPVCHGTAIEFISAWTSELHARGYVSGYYSSTSSGIVDEVSAVGSTFAVPDDIWFASWRTPPRANIFGEPGVPDAFWSNHQRLHQYAGSHNETWGGATINIDNDVNDGQLAG